ncbi:MAG TPA: ABC transporter permease [Streptosporangiaceae bacterium]|nr:ABC transporter permease [Streptosporangiaceae bacterium]
MTAEASETPTGSADGSTVANLTATSTAGSADVPPELLAHSLDQYVRAWWLRVRSGNSGVLPVVFAIVLVAVVFEIITPEHAFLRPSNLVYIFGLSTVYMVLAMAETVVLLLGEIDLSVGAVALFGGVIAFKLVQQPGPDWPWWAAMLAALACCGLIGALQGTLTARLKIPSFIVTLGGFLLFSGILVVILGGANGTAGVNSSVPNQRVIYNLVQGLIVPVVGWVALAVVVGAAGAALWLRAAARRRQGLVAPPASVTAIRIALVALVGVAVVVVCNGNRGTSLVTVQGVPWVIPIVLVVLGIWTLLLQRTRFGRYVHAIGGSPEAARRAGISLAAIRTWAFALCSATAGLGGILLGSFFFGQYSTNTADPGQLVLYSVAASVIGGVSLFGGRGKAIHGVLGGLLIGAIAYGVSLLNLGTLATPLEYILPGGVLLGAVLIDVLSRRGTGSVTGA